MFKRKSLKAAINKYNKLCTQKGEMSDEIVKFLKNLENHFEEAFNHIENDSVPATNNLLEQFYKITFPRKIKKIFRTPRGARKRIFMNNYRYTINNTLTSKSTIKVV